MTATAVKASQLLWWTIFAESSLEPQPRQPERSRRFWFLVREKQARGPRLAADVDQVPQLRCSEVHRCASRQRRLGLDCQNGFTSSSTCSTSLPHKVLRNSNCPVTPMVFSSPAPR